MRDDPYPCRYYPRLEEELAPEPAAASAAGAESSLGRDFRRALSILVALYLLVGVVFALSNRANAAPLSAPLGAAGQPSVPAAACSGDLGFAHP
jgi:hypothetical protein